MPPERRDDPLDPGPAPRRRLRRPTRMACGRSITTASSVAMIGGRNWTAVDAARPSGFGFAVAVHPAEPQTAWFVPAMKDERRVPVDDKLVVSRTRDGGQTFEVFDRGLPAPSFDLVYRHALDVDGTGKRACDGIDHRRPVAVGKRGRVVARRSRCNLPPIYAVRFGG